jgi:hypothetical protein
MQNNQLTLSNLSLLNSTKSERKAFAMEVLEQLEEGNYNPLQMHVSIKNMEALLKTFTDKKDSPEIAERYGKIVLEEAEKNGKKFEMYNAGFQIKETGTTYDFTVCNDPVMADLLRMQEEIKAKVKERGDFLKTLPDEGMEVRHEDELITIYKPAKSSTTTLAVSLK